MTIYRDKKNGQEYGTYKIERVILRKRLRLTTTTKDQRVARQIEDLLLEIKDYGRTDLLDQLVRSKDKSGTLRNFWVLHKKNKLFTHDPEKEVHNSLPLRDELEKWMKTYSGWNEKSRKDFQEKISTLFSRTNIRFPNPTLEDSHKSLRDYRGQCEERGSHSTFIHVRSVFLKFFRSQYGKSHELTHSDRIHEYAAEHLLLVFPSHEDSAQPRPASRAIPFSPNYPASSTLSLGVGTHHIAARFFAIRQAYLPRRLVCPETHSEPLAVDW